MKRSETFDEYRRKHEASRAKLISAALRGMSNSKYSNITSLARDVAKLVTELEMSKLSDSDGGETYKSMSHVTLLRNVKYRALLEDFLRVKREPAESAASSISEIESLKFSNASLRAKVSMLTEKIRAIDSGASLEEDGEAEAKINSLYGDLDLVVGIINSTFKELKGILLTVREGATTSKQSQPGLWGPMGMVATFEAMQELDRICDDLARWRKKPKQLTSS